VKTPTVQVGELALNDSGAFKIGPFGSSLKKTELVESGIPVAGIENVLPNKFVKGFRRFITARKFEELSDYEILPDDVLVTTMGTIGRAAFAPPDVGRVIFDSHLFRMRVDTNRVFPPYLCYALNSDLVASQLARMARGGDHGRAEHDYSSGMFNPAARDVRAAADRREIGAGGSAAIHPPLHARTHRHLPPRRLPRTLR